MRVPLGTLNYDILDRQRTRRRATPCPAPLGVLERCIVTFAQQRAAGPRDPDAHPGADGARRKPLDHPAHDGPMASPVSIWPTTVARRNITKKPLFKVDNASNTTGMLHAITT